MDFKTLLKNQGLTDEQVNAITGAMAAEKIYLSSEENIDDRYKKLKVKKEALQDELKEANATIEALKKDNISNKDLQDKVKEYETTIDNLKKDNEKKNFDMALELELTKANVKNSKAIKALLDLEKIKLKDGVFDGLDSQLEELKKTDDYLFNTGEKKKVYNPEGGSKASTGDLATLMKSKDFNLTDYLKNQNKE